MPGKLLSCQRLDQHFVGTILDKGVHVIVDNVPRNSEYQTLEAELLANDAGDLHPHRSRHLIVHENHVE